VAILHNMAVEHRSNEFIASMRMATERAVRGAEPDAGDSQSTGGHGTAFVMDKGPACGAVWGAPVPVSYGQANGGRGFEGAQVGAATHMRMAKTEANETRGHFQLLNHFAENMWAGRSRLLTPFLRLADVRGLR